MPQGGVVALVLSALLVLVLAFERVARMRAHRTWPVLRDVVPVLSVVLGAQCAATLFTLVSELAPPRFLPTLAVSAALALPSAVVNAGRARRIVAGLTIAIIAFLAFADAVYFRFFGAIVPLLGTSNAKQAWDVSSSIATLLLPRDFAFVVPVAAGIWLAASRPPALRGETHPMTNSAFRFAIALSLVGILFLSLDVAGWLKERHSVAIYSWKGSLHRTGIFGGHARDMARTWRIASQTGEPPSPRHVRTLHQYLDTTRTPVPDDSFGNARGKNLVVIQVEALQQWVIDTRVRGVEITPFLNRLKRERAMYFSGLWDQTAISPTADCEYLAMNSLHPLPDAAVVFRHAENDFVALPGLLGRQGYSTLSLHAFERGFWNRATIHPRYGFQHSHFDRELGPGPKVGWGLPDKILLPRALAQLDRTPAPFMALIITLTSHHPYDFIPLEERHIDTTGLPELLAGYVTSMRYVDEALADFFAAFATRPYASNSVIAVYGDHESKIVFDEAAEAQARPLLSLDSQTLDDLGQRSFATRKIPLFVVLPESTQGRTLAQVGGQIDISPTLLHLFGFSKPQPMIGRPLFGEGGAVVRHDGAAIEGDRLRLADGGCRTLGGKSLPPGDCASLGKRADEQLKASWAITQYNLAEQLANGLSASR
jgi:phosphoglycerol transferase MdoB-like AlkP superfamily enzyme